jgi:glycosyltransferase involved in cell wall biosynthesis
MCENFLDTIRECRGEYIAFCDGDDYWIKKTKLTDQVNFLDSFPLYSGACSSVYLKQSDSERLEPQLLHSELESEEDVTLTRMLENFTLHTATFMCRRSSLPLEVFEKGAPAMDIGVFLVCLHSGNVRFFNSNDAVYRVHAAGVTYSREFYRFYEMVLEFLDYFDEFTNDKYRVHTDKKRRRLEFYRSVNSPRTSAIKKFGRIIRYCIRYRNEVGMLELKNIIGLAFPRAVASLLRFRKNKVSGLVSCASTPNISSV